MNQNRTVNHGYLHRVVDDVKLSAKSRNFYDQSQIVPAGGMAGIGAVLIAAQIIDAITEWRTVISPGAMIGAFLFSAVVGIFFGYYSARTAARLNIVPLRYE